MLTIDINADLGEGGDQDDLLMTLVSSCNIACGGHAGNDETMRRTVDAAIAAGVAIGAHPGYEDPEHFGRKFIQMSPTAIEEMVERQITRLLAIHSSLHHVKPHGAFYHHANLDADCANAMARVIQRLLPSCLLYAPSHGALRDAAAAHGLIHCVEGFIDRRYMANGDLCPRSEPGAMIASVDEAVAQALRITLDQQVTTITGQTISLSVRTLCIHGDNPSGPHIMDAVRQQFGASKIVIKPPQC